MSAVTCVERLTPIAVVRAMFADNRVSAVAVVDGDRCAVGFLTLRDLVTAPGAALVDTVMMPFAFSVDVHTPIEIAARLMVCEGISHVAVHDRGRRVVGVVSALAVVTHVVEHGELA